MSLLDHFHPPLSQRRHWHAFHNAWATYISEDLNQHLPQGYFAESNVQFGIEIDVAAFEESDDSDPVEIKSKYLWRPPEPIQTIPLEIETDILEVSIFSSIAGPVLVGAVELISPANKDRASHRDTFVSKCETYIRQGIGLMIVDIVTNRQANLHVELLNRLGFAAQKDEKNLLYTAAYRPIEVDHQPNLQIWQEPLQVGQPLPTMPLWLRGDLCVPLNLNQTYEKTCRTRRISDVPSLR